MTTTISILPALSALSPPTLGAREGKERHYQTGIKPAEMNKGCYGNKVNTKRINLNKKGENKKGAQKCFLKKGQHKHYAVIYRTPSVKPS